MHLSFLRSLSQITRKIPLSYILIVPFVAQISVVVGLTGWASSRNSQETVNDLTSQLRQEVALRIEQKLDALLSLPSRINRLNQNAFILRDFTPGDLEAIDRYLYHQSQVYENVDSIFWGNQEGDLIGTTHFEPGQYISMQAGEATGGAIQFYALDAQGRRSELIRETPGFDPRDRPWYQAAAAAGQPTWGRIFKYHAYDRMAIPAVSPVYDDGGTLVGVLGNNFFLSQISDFLAQIKLGKTGQTYIIERSGEIVASSTQSQLFIMQDGMAQRIHITDSQNPLLRESGQFLIEQYQNFDAIQSVQQLDFQLEQSRQLVQVTPFQDELGLDWLIVVVMPESDFMAQIQAGTRRTILLCLLALAGATAFSWLTSRWIVRSLQQLIRASQGIAGGNLQQTIRPGNIQELASLATSFNQMAANLQDSFNALNDSNQALQSTLIDLQSSEQKFRRFAENSDAVLWIYDLAHDCSVYVSPAFERVWQRSCDDLMQDHRLLLTSIHPDDRGRFLAELGSLEQANSYGLDYRIVWPDGSIRWIRDRGFILSKQAGIPQWLGGIAEDITDRKLVEQALTERESKYRLLAENMSDLVCLHQLDSTYLYISSSVQALLGYSSPDLLGTHHFDLVHPDDRDRIQQELQDCLDGTAVFLTYRIRKKIGVYCWFETIAQGILDDAGRVYQFQTTSRDITDKMRMQKKLEHDALHDALTGLPNRNLVTEKLQMALQHLHNHDDYQFALLFLDLDRFKLVNDSLGHLAGDEILITVSRRIQSAVTSLDFVARLGGDEFIIMLQEIGGLHDVIRVTRHVLEQLDCPIMLNHQPVVVGGSIGIVMGTLRYANPADMIRDADIAMYRAKEKGRSRYEVFDPAMHIQACERLQLENDLRHALEKQELFICYQPIINCETAQLKGFEALIRWQHPHRGLVSPAEFIPIAEETQLIIPIGLWMLEQVAHQIQEWQQLCQRPQFRAEALVISVNVSAVQLKSEGFIQSVDQILQDTGLSGDHFVFEITESILIDDLHTIIEILKLLRDRAIAVSIDDFGTGYSSLSYLCNLPITMLKVDKSFVSQMLTGRKNHRVVETILILTRQLGLKSVAEGIETVEQLEGLKALGCNYGQGYLFSKPARATEAVHWLTHLPEIMDRQVGST
ncbi:MAG: EAL domain-containing protein [Leptolyngbyaceae cyanobacterium]